ncbi:diflavin oxidoreductase [Methylophaga sp. OBS4]|uniref:diflavin oxidoreductase n=1 Tax=Methylophaga sp. OBS4 TaxID=2991935 RepID=UPI00225A4175|nr:flavodoxin domain-containing protein [Methylophaga sp. OBS4]MCX4186876.1 flavodoxin domain-containing protein [Methylophaga sp. OBS4]
MQNAEQALFTDKQYQDSNLVDDLNSSQTRGLGQHLTTLTKVERHEAKSQNKPWRIVVGYGTETGNSKGIAQQFNDQARENGKFVEVKNLADLKVRHLANIDFLFIVCSTHGDGDPPESVELFYNALLDYQASLEDTAFAVLALGDSTYDLFCETGKTIDKKLAELCAQQLLECYECDVDFEHEAQVWIKRCLKFIPETGSSGGAVHATTKRADSTAFSKNNPLQIEVLENITLTGPSRVNAIHHLELALNPNHHFNLRPGDSIGIFPHNPPDLVHAILELCHFSGDESVTIKETAMPLVQALREHCDLTVVSAKFFNEWSMLSQNQELLGLIEDKKKVRAFLKIHQLTQILSVYPLVIEPQLFVDLLRPLQPRLYDVSNSLDAVDNEIHLTVELYQYCFAGKRCNGIASKFLLDLEPGELLSIFPQHNKRFQLPTNHNVPIIMIADGTGIAPFRAFIQEIENKTERCHPTWLLFCEQTFTEDFLYQVDWQQALQSGSLTRLDTLFHADIPSATLLDLMADSYDLFKGWLEAGAHIYLSGHKHEMETLEKSLNAALGSDPGISQKWTQLSSQNRLHRNLY